MISKAGGSGSDEVRGNLGKDTISGVDAAGAAPGQAEIDTLGGGQGIDRFILGDSSKVYYHGDGFGGMALILNFNPGEDIIQLKGPKENYFLVLPDVGAGAVRTDIYLDLARRAAGRANRSAARCFRSEC